MARSKGGETINAAKAYRGTFLFLFTVRLFLFLIFLSPTEGNYR
jgi:hypothetical protein